ncbi:hypothetical protein BDR04DRAFT_1103120, partial [Suillus decipiens]
MLLVPIPYNNFVISVNLQFLSLIKVTLLSIHHFQTNIQPSLLYQNHTHYTATHSKFIPSFLSILLYPVKRDATLIWLCFHI